MQCGCCWRLQVILKVSAAELVCPTHREGECTADNGQEAAGVGAQAGQAPQPGKEEAGRPPEQHGQGATAVAAAAEAQPSVLHMESMESLHLVLWSQHW